MYRTLTRNNIQTAIAEYVASISEVGANLPRVTGLELLIALKRAPTGAGPYAHVTLLEAANRIMTDLVILRGVQWLLDSSNLPFASYDVEFGNEDQGEHDLLAQAGDIRLRGEAFNVAPSFFQGKKARMLSKLRRSEPKNTTRLVLANLDAVPATYEPKLGVREMMLLVDVGGQMDARCWHGDDRA